MSDELEPCKSKETIVPPLMKHFSVLSPERENQIVEVVNDVLKMLEPVRKNDFNKSSHMFTFGTDKPFIESIKKSGDACIVQMHNKCHVLDYSKYDVLCKKLQAAEAGLKQFL